MNLQSLQDLQFVGKVIHGVFEDVPGCRWAGILHVYEWGFPEDFHQSFGFWLTENNQWMVVNHCKE